MKTVMERVKRGVKRVKRILKEMLEGAFSRGCRCLLAILIVYASLLFIFLTDATWWEGIIAGFLTSSVVFTLSQWLLFKIRKIY